MRREPVRVIQYRPSAEVRARKSLDRLDTIIGWLGYTGIVVILTLLCVGVL